MSYLLDKKLKKKKIFRAASAVVMLLVLFIFRYAIFSGLSYVSENAFHPVLVFGNFISTKLSSLDSYFVSKSSLYSQNQKLQAEVTFDDARMANYDSVMADDASIKEILGRMNPKVNMVLGNILAKPNQSPYDTLVIDAGSVENIKVGDIVFAEGNIPIGRISDIFTNSAKVILFSNPGETTDALISGSNVSVQLVGRGGGNFEIQLPKDFNLVVGTQVVLPGIDTYLIAITQTIISDPRDSLTKALLTSPVNIEQLKFVEVEE